MKNLFKSMMLVAAAAMGFTACSKDATEEAAPETKGATEIITISTDITRTTLNAGRTQLTWVAGDQFAVYTDQGTKNTPVTYTDGAVNFDLEVAAGSQTVYAYYPYYDRQSTQYDQTSVSMYVTSTQNQKEAGVFDGNTNDYVMVAKGAIDADKHVGLTFKPVACALAFNIYGGQAEEKVESVTFDPGVVCAGQHYMDITVDNPVYTAANGSATSVTVTLENTFEAVGEKPADPKAFANQVYAVVARKVYEGATITVKTSLNTYTFKTASTLDLTTDFFTMNLNLAKGETPEPGQVYTLVSSLADLNTTDTYIIAGNNSETYEGSAKMYIWNGTVNSKNKTRLNCNEAEEAIGNTITPNQTVQEIKLETAPDGKYYINVGNQYLSVSGTTLSVSETKTAWAINNDWKVSTKEGFYFSTTNCYVFCNSASTTAIRAYGSSTQYKGIYFFKKGDGNTPSEPQLTISNFIATLNSEKAEISFTGTYTNTYEVEPQWSLTVSKDGSEIGSITVKGESGQIVADNYSVEEDGSYTFTLTATIDEQTVATKTAEVIVSDGSEPNTISIIRSNFNNGSSWSSYATQTAKVTGSDNSEYSITAEGIAYNINYIQIRQSKNSVIYNTTNLGNIKSIVIEDSTAATYNVWVGTSEKPSTTSVTGDADSRTFNVTGESNGYFKITNANTTISNITKITVTYTK